MSVIEDNIDVLKAEQDMETLRDHALAITKAERGSTRKGMAMWLMVQQGAVVNQAGTVGTVRCDGVGVASGVSG